MSSNIDISSTFWPTLNRVMNVNLEPGNYSASEFNQWNSLKHVELVFDLGDRFKIQIAPDDIARLYSDTNEILSFLNDSQSK